MEFKHLTAYAAVVRRNSFSKAAEELYLSQPTVSMYIRQLEEELNTVLLVRTTKSLEITPKGREVYEYALNILSMKEKLLRNCGENGGDIISIGASTVPSAYLLPEVLASYRKKNSRIQFAVDQGDSRLILKKLKDGLYDLGVIGMDPGDDQLSSIPFFLDTIVITTPCEERFRKLKEADCTDPSEGALVLRELLSEPMILREEGSASKYAVDLFLKQAGVPESSLNVTARINDPEAIKNMVAMGIGSAIMSVRAAENYEKQGLLLTFPFPGEGCHRSFYLVQRKDGLLTERVQEFSRFLLEYYKSVSEAAAL